MEAEDLELQQHTVVEDEDGNIHTLVHEEVTATTSTDISAAATSTAVSVEEESTAVIEQHTGETTSGDTTTALIQEEDGTYSSYYLTKADNEYYLINKKLRVDGDDQPGDGKTQRHM